MRWFLWMRSWWSRTWRSSPRRCTGPWRRNTGCFLKRSVQHISILFYSWRSPTSLVRTRRLRSKYFMLSHKSRAMSPFKRAKCYKNSIKCTSVNASNNNYFFKVKILDIFLLYLNLVKNLMQKKNMATCYRRYTLVLNPLVKIWILALSKLFCASI